MELKTMTATANGVPCRLVWKSKTDGYFYDNDSAELIRCDHSGDDSYGAPRGPDACEHGVLFVDVNRLRNEGVTLALGAPSATLPLKNGHHCLVDADKGLRYLMARYSWLRIYILLGTERFQLKRVVDEHKIT